MTELQEIERSKKRIEYYLSQLGPGDKETQFHDACIIAYSALRSLEFREIRKQGLFKDVSIELPPVCEEVIGFHEEWIDPDFNPEGTRLCFLQDNERWMICCWENDYDSWISVESDSYWKYYDLIMQAPTHWTYKPKFK